ncbi:MAG TPA: DUF4160 domain-containing protein [Pirellulales bacterium]|nr:DUF4160 domain-containing protein [Pirellulales bacterium]
MAEKRRKAGGRYTEPDLPDRVIGRQGAVTIEHFYRSGDHGPPHLHVSGGGASTRIGQNGRILKGGSSLTAVQQQAVDEYRTAMRKALRKIGRWHWFDRLP